MSAAEIRRGKKHNNYKLRAAITIGQWIHIRSNRKHCAFRLRIYIFFFSVFQTKFVFMRRWTFAFFFLIWNSLEHFQHWFEWIRLLWNGIDIDRWLFKWCKIFTVCMSKNIAMIYQGSTIFAENKKQKCSQLFLFCLFNPENKNQILRANFTFSMISFDDIQFTYDTRSTWKRSTIVNVM